MTQDWHRVVTLTQGVAMVVTDIHGDWDAYRRYRDIFIRAYEKGNLQYLIFTGDLIHRESPPHEDQSLEIVLDVHKLRFGFPEAVIYLCGNHEFPHIYNITLSKGDFLYTPRFEARLGEHRTRIVSLFRSLPFFVRTQAGLALVHAGASALFTDEKEYQRIFTFQHQAVFNAVRKLVYESDIEALRSAMIKLSGESYDTQAQRYLSVTDKNDPRYNDLLYGFLASSDPNFRLLWKALFTRCEQDYGNSDYRIFLIALLKALSTDFYPQNSLLAGHMDVKNGYTLIAKQHLRMASGKHANPPQSARYLVFDVATPINSAKDLTNMLRSIY